MTFPATGSSYAREQTRAEWLKKKRRVLFYAAAGFLCLTTPCSSSSFGPADGICDEFTLKSHAEADSRGAGRRRQHAQTKVGRKRSESSFRRLASLVADEGRHGGSRSLKIRNVIASIKKEQQEMTAVKFLERLDRALRRRGHRESGRGNARYRWFMKPSGIRALWLRRGKKGSLFGSIKKALPLTNVIRLARRSRGGSKAARTSALCKAVRALRSTRKSTKLPLDTAALASLIEAPQAAQAPLPKSPPTFSGDDSLRAPLLGGSPSTKHPVLLKRWRDLIEEDLKELHDVMERTSSIDQLGPKLMEKQRSRRMKDLYQLFFGLDKKQRERLRTILTLRYRCRLEAHLPSPTPTVAQEGACGGQKWDFGDRVRVWAVRKFYRWALNAELRAVENHAKKFDGATTEKWGRGEVGESSMPETEQEEHIQEAVMTLFPFHNYWYSEHNFRYYHFILEVAEKYLSREHLAQRFSYDHRLDEDGGRSRMKRELESIAEELVEAVREARAVYTEGLEGLPPSTPLRNLMELFGQCSLEGLLERVIRNRLDPIFKAGGADDPQASWSQWEAWEKDLAMCDEVIESVSGPLVEKIFEGRNPQQGGWNEQYSI